MRTLFGLMVLVTGFWSQQAAPPPPNLIDAVLAARHPHKQTAELPLVDDVRFMRRLWLDLAGMVPPADVRARWQAKPHPWDRAAMVDELLWSDYFDCRMTHFLETMLRSTVTFNFRVRDNFHTGLHNMMARNYGWDRMAIHLLNWSGRLEKPEGLLNFWTTASGTPNTHLDMLDDQMGFLGDKLLGIPLTCISCHDGAYHLEEVNKGLTAYRREDFWAMAAFLADSGFYCETGCYDANGYRILNNWVYRGATDLPAEKLANFAPRYSGAFNGGDYVAVSEPGEGMRPARDGGLIAPRYMFTGEEPDPSLERRLSLARLMGKDRQFARNMVNRLWKHFFGTAFVEPLNGWDLARIDADTAAAHDTTVQPSDPELLEALTDDFIEAGMSFRNMAKIITTSRLYQLDLDQPAPDTGSSDPNLAGVTRYRRLEAEAVAMSMAVVLDTPFAVRLVGTARPVTNLWDLPDLVGPFESGEVRDVLRALGGDNRFDTGPADSLDRSAVLTLMNSRDLMEARLQDSPVLAALLQRLQTGADPALVVADLYDRALMRPPTEAEAASAVAYLQQGISAERVADLFWRCFLHEDFLFR